MKKLLLVLVLLSSVLGFTSCLGPVNKVLPDPNKFAQVRDTVFARGLCLNDTVTFTLVKDSVKWRDSLTTDTVFLPGSRELVLRAGKIRIMERIVTKIKTNTVRDVSKETVLLKQRAQTDLKLQHTLLKLSQVQNAFRVRTLQSILLLIVLLVLAFYWVKKTFFG